MGVRLVSSSKVRNAISLKLSPGSWDMSSAVSSKKEAAGFARASTRAGDVCERDAQNLRLRARDWMCGSAAM